MLFHFSQNFINFIPVGWWSNAESSLNMLPQIFELLGNLHNSDLEFSQIRLIDMDKKPRKYIMGREMGEGVG